MIVQVACASDLNLKFAPRKLRQPKKIEQEKVI